MGKIKHTIIIILIISISIISCRKDDIKDNGSNGVPTIEGSYSWGNVAIGGGGFVTGFVTCPTEANLIYMRTDVGGAYRWMEASQTWKPITDFIGPDETSLLGIESIAVDPNSPNKVYIAAGTSYWDNGLSCILISNDYGESFQQIDVTSQFKFHGNGMGRQNGERLAIDPNYGEILFCGTRAHGLWKSTNSGQTWSKVESFPVTTTTNGNGICFVQFDPLSSTTGSATQKIFVGVSRTGESNLYVSNDAGSTWEPVSGAITNYMPMRSLLSNGKLYITYADAEGPWNSGVGQIKKYIIADSQWIDITPESGTAFSGITTNSDNSMLVATSINKWIKQVNNQYGDEIYRSTDDGTSWTRLYQDGVSTHEAGDIGWMFYSSLHWAGDVKIDPYNPDRAFITSGNGVFMTSNLTQSNPLWVFTSKGLEETVPLDLVSIPGGPLVSVIGDYDGFMHYDISAYPATRHVPSMGTSTGVGYASKKPEFIVRVGGSESYEAMYYTEDNGESWRRANTISIGKNQGRVAVSADGECILWSPGSGTTMYWTTDLGGTWTACKDIVGRYIPVADPVNPDVFYAYGASNKLYVSYDKGVTFTTVRLAFTGGSTLIRTIPGKEGQLLIAGYESGLFHLTEKGIKYIEIETVTYCQAVGTGKAAPGSTFPSIFIYGRTLDSDALGIYRSDDIGATWVRVDDEDHQFGSLANGGFVIGDNNVFGRIYRSSAGRGIIYGDIN